MKAAHRLIFLILISSLVLWFPHSARADVPVELVSSVSQTVIAQNHTIQLTVSCLWEGAPDAITIDYPRNPDCYLLDIEEVEQENFFALYPDQKLNRIQLTYTLRAAEPGEGRISYFAIEYTESETGVKRIKKTEPFDITIMSRSRYLLRQTANMVSIGFILALIAAAIFITIRIIHKKRTQAHAARQMNADISDESEKEALNKLQQARKYKISGDSFKFFETIRTVLNEYFEGKNPVADMALNASDSEAVEHAALPQNIQVEYKEIIAACNRIKFSGEQLSAEALDQWYNRAVKLISFYMEHIQREQTEKKMQNITLRDNGGA